MTIRHIILLRKLSLIRALFLRFGPAWATRCRAAGCYFDSKKLCDTSHWGVDMDRLEALARNYGFVCPLDDLGPAKEYEAILTQALQEDLKRANLLQDPTDQTTAGSLENFEANPNNALPLGEAIAAAFGLPPIPPHKLPGTGFKDSHTASIPESDRTLLKLAAQGFSPDAHDLRRQLNKALKGECVRRGQRQRSPRQKMQTTFKKLKKLTAEKK